MAEDEKECKQYICKTCNSIFASYKSLDHHRRTAKYCLEMQGKMLDKYKCIGCQRHFCSNNSLLNHQSTCLEFIKEQHEIEKKALLAEIQELKNTIKDLAEKAISNAKPTIHNNHHNNTTINNHIENLNVITEAHIQDQAKHLTIEHIKKGALGYSEYFLEHPLKDRVVCTDYSRRKLKYKNEQGEVVTDPELSKLSDLLFKSIKERNRELTIQYTNELTDKFKTASSDPAQLSYFMEVASKFSQQDLEVFRMFNGDKNDFFHDILRNICSKTVVQ